MKNYFLAIGVVLLSSVFALPVLAQESEKVVPQTNWSFDVLKRLCEAADITECRPTEKTIDWCDFYRSDFTLTRQKAALATLKIADRLETRISNNKPLNLSYNDDEHPPNGYAIRDLEVKDAMQALFMEYEAETRSYGVTEKWLQQQLKPEASATQPNRVLDSAWHFGIAQRECGF